MCCFYFKKGLPPPATAVNWPRAGLIAARPSAEPSCSQGHRATGKVHWGRGTHTQKQRKEVSRKALGHHQPPDARAQPRKDTLLQARDTHPPNVPGAGKNRLPTRSLMPHNNPKGYCHPRFTDGETKEQRGEVTCPRAYG